MRLRWILIIFMPAVCAWSSGGLALHMPLGSTWRSRLPIAGGRLLERNAACDSACYVRDRIGTPRGAHRGVEDRGRSARRTRRSGGAPTRICAGEGNAGDRRADAGSVSALDDDADRAAFTGWFTYLAEAQYFAPALPPEISDCAALLRFAYREALREHDGRWAERSEAYRPCRPSRACASMPILYAPGRTPVSHRDGFAEFADAQTLIRYNAYSLGRDLRAAAPGDLLFYRQLDASQPFHTMIFLGDLRGLSHRAVSRRAGRDAAALGDGAAPPSRAAVAAPRSAILIFSASIAWNILRR